MLTIEVLFEGLKVLYVHSSKRSGKLEEGSFFFKPRLAAAAC